MLDNNDLEEYQTGKYRGYLTFNYPSTEKRLAILKEIVIKDIAKIIHDYDQTCITVKYHHFPSNYSYMSFTVNHSMRLHFVEYDIVFIYSFTKSDDVLIIQRNGNLLIYSDDYAIQYIKEFNFLIFLNEYIKCFMDKDKYFKNVLTYEQSCIYNDDCFQFIDFRENIKTNYKVLSYTKIEKIIDALNILIPLTRYMFKLL